MNTTPTRRGALQFGLKAGGALAAASAFPGLRGTAHAQGSRPAKPIRLLVPFAPGGSSEIVARTAANQLGKSLGQSVFVDNKPGTSGHIGMQECAARTDRPTRIPGQ